MEIDLGTVIFATINFFVLLFLLKKFLYKPIMGMLDSRKAEVEDNLNAAQVAKDEAARLKDEYAASIANARHEAQEILAQATQMGEQAKDDIVAGARLEAQKVADKASADIEIEKNQAIAALRNEVADLAVLAAEKIVGKTIDLADHGEMVNNFVQEVGDAQ